MFARVGNATETLIPDRRVTTIDVEPCPKPDQNQNTCTEPDLFVALGTDFPGSVTDTIYIVSSTSLTFPKACVGAARLPIVTGSLQGF